MQGRMNGNRAFQQYYVIFLRHYVILEELKEFATKTRSRKGFRLHEPQTDHPLLGGAARFKTI